MWIPETIELFNLFSHEHSVFHFRKEKMTMFIGVNGAGKSSINEAIDLALTGEVARKVNKEEFIRTGTDECTVVLTLDNRVLDKIMLIRRTLHRRRTAVLYVEVNGKEVVKSDISEREAYIFAELGFTMEDYFNYFVIGQGNENSFFSASDTKQKETIGRFSNYQPIDQLIEELRKDVTAKEKEVQQHQSSIDRLEGSNEALEEELVDIEQNFETDRAERVNEATQSLQQVRSRIKELEVDIQEQTAQIKAKTATIKQPKKLDVDKLELKKAGKAAEKFETGKEVKEANTMLTQLYQQKGKELTCPYCKKAFIPQSQFANKQEVEQAIKAVEETIDQYDEYMKSLDNDMEECTKAIQAYSDANRKNKLIQQEIDSLERIKNNNGTQLASHKSKITQIEDQITEIKAQTVTNRVKELTAKITENKRKIETLVVQQEEAKKVIEEKKFFEYHFGIKGFKSYLARKSIRNIQDVCNWYLNKFQIGMQTLISGFTTLKSGEVRDKIEISIVREDGTKGLFKKFSGGEKNRINICGVLTIHALINNSCGYGKGLDLLCFDEISFLDEEGQEKIVEILGRAGITSILVMHNAKSIQCENRLFIAKENGISKVYEK